ncbi:protein kinase activating protein dpb11 [Elasticomyces elasticus]|uniref:Protein kinase activating protein dpb11 n=1 Tax=Exophiala sideris TaxID=1016849 RepID=A0ABR0JK56_9EURO|nr:protein kinase activating protein dpb11 [Elasticomyces elasticus]KAK5034248.1 protein kinase activating protein dpb11 [Exophiala sideris]KAK5042544.1 protein kinase activating protein dpb11 [Exophiala sideris]KAK5065626.1 protein kinase activating protein dpb11 [Exophiala sideris]KAK5185915.1 protein kinase activating protein dpb11 [Eurotiomycetes sp. CCFEE 6388]
MAKLEARGSAERPLQGVILCFTSIGPEERTRYADLAVQMGAEHKLDLTSDTTHLIVGSTDTAKYQYVAREREDIKVLRPEWIEAVRERWINDLALNLDALAQEYRVPTLAGLKICITGFDDLSFRAQLQRNVLENGGEYTGDLTKDVTHLIAAKPEGKKYEYGLQWQKKVVSLKWYKDTLERGMQLDESLYNPTFPVDAQGAGAWNRGSQRSPRPAKRVREESSVPEPARKLRRTASAKFGSQTQNLWTDIVGGAGFDADPVGRPHLKSSISMPSLQQGETSMKQSTKSRTERHEPAADSETHRSNSGFLAGHNFIVEAFDERKENIVRNIILDNGGTIASPKECQAQGRAASDTLLIVPHDCGKEWKAELTPFSTALHAISELWLERCLFHRTFVEADQYPLGQVKRQCLGQLANLTVNATGFDGLETKHISQMVKLLGGKYTEKFTAGVSVLVCKKGSYNREKLGMARRDGIAAVSEEWLWSSIREDEKASMAKYSLYQNSNRAADDREDGRPRHRTEEYVEVSTVPLRPEGKGQPVHSEKKPDGARTETKRPSKRTANQVEVHQDTMHDSHGQAIDEGHNVEERDCASGRSETQAASSEDQDFPLQELSSNSSGKHHPSLQAKKNTVQPLDGNVRLLEPSGAENDHETARSAPAPQSNDRSGSIHAMNGAIRDFLDQEIRKKPAASGSSEPRKKGRLMGRVLSNLSNTSATSRLSRASSIDSINTDGIGSEIGNAPSARQSGEAGSTTEKSTFSFAGRAKATLAGLKPQSVPMDDFDMPQHIGQPEEETPRLTQLGYEDPEEAIILREKLAASRRKKSKLGQGEEDPKPGVRRVRVDRKIRDDDVLTDAGWGVGRRTRHKQ